MGRSPGSGFLTIFSWGKVSTVHEQMVYAEATMAVPILAAHAYRTGHWKSRKPPAFTRIFGE